MSKHLRKANRRTKRLHNSPAKVIIWFGIERRPDAKELQGYIEFTDLRIRSLYPSGFKNSKGNFIVMSSGYPAFSQHQLFLWGCDQSFNGSLMQRSFSLHSQLQEYMDKCLQILEEFSRVAEFGDIPKLKWQEDPSPPNEAKLDTRLLWTRHVFK
jgi:hypothetical protein